MRVLIVWGSTRGGTEGIAHDIAGTLVARGYSVTASSAAHAPPPAGFDAAIIGGALYANRWHRGALHYANRHAHALRRMPVWLFSSGPLDATADAHEIAPTGQVEALAQRIGALGHATFGGRLERDAAGFIAQAMAKTHAGDWRNPDRIRAWANHLADVLPSARPGVAHDPPARAWSRLVGHAALGWAAATAILSLLWVFASPHAALAMHALVAPIAFGAIAWHYFEPHGARQPMPTALAFATFAALLDLAIAPRAIALASHIAGFWLAIALVALATWAIGAVRSTMPWPKPDPANARP